uniref:Uncharacterized protein n=1 Tax=viral metagenome TaxID=1070528 RepID=A0A2V0RB58_9ZZZZ
MKQRSMDMNVENQREGGERPSTKSEETGTEPVTEKRRADVAPEEVRMLSQEEAMAQGGLDAARYDEVMGIVNGGSPHHRRPWQPLVRELFGRAPTAARTVENQLEVSPMPASNSLSGPQLVMSATMSESSDELLELVKKSTLSQRPDDDFFEASRLHLELSRRLMECGSKGIGTSFALVVARLLMLAMGYSLSHVLCRRGPMVLKWYRDTFLQKTKSQAAFDVFLARDYHNSQRYNVVDVPTSSPMGKDFAMAAIYAAVMSGEQPEARLYGMMAAPVNNRGWITMGEEVMWQNAQGELAVRQLTRADVRGYGGQIARFLCERLADYQVEKMAWALLAQKTGIILRNLAGDAFVTHEAAVGGDDGEHVRLMRHLGIQEEACWNRMDRFGDDLARDTDTGAIDAAIADVMRKINSQNELLADDSKTKAADKKSLQTKQEAQLRKAGLETKLDNLRLTRSEIGLKRAVGADGHPLTPDECRNFVTRRPAPAGRLGVPRGPPAGPDAEVGIERDATSWMYNGEASTCIMGASLPSPIVAWAMLRNFYEPMGDRVSLGIPTNAAEVVEMHQRTFLGGVLTFEASQWLSMTPLNVWMWAWTGLEDSPADPREWSQDSICQIEERMGAFGVLYTTRQLANSALFTLPGIDRSNTAEGVPMYTAGCCRIAPWPLEHLFGFEAPNREPPPLGKRLMATAPGGTAAPGYGGHSWDVSTYALQAPAYVTSGRDQYSSQESLPIVVRGEHGGSRSWRLVAQNTLGSQFFIDDVRAEDMRSLNVVPAYTNQDGGMQVRVTGTHLPQPGCLAPLGSLTSHCGISRQAHNAAMHDPAQPARGRFRSFRY